MPCFNPKAITKRFNIIQSTILKSISIGFSCITSSLICEIWNKFVGPYVI
jgi:hypothetical protein